MSIRVAYDKNTQNIGLSLVPQLDEDATLETAVTLSLFTDARSTDEDLKRYGFTAEQNRGFWGDEFADVPDDQSGSRLWLLARALKNDDALLDGRTFAEEALAWLVVDGVATAVATSTSWLPNSDSMRLEISIERDGRPKWAGVWSAQSGEVIS